jgi:glutamine amidotransferase
MCRFLMVKSVLPLEIENFLLEFSEACKKRKTPDGDWQGDGWGISYLDENYEWNLYRSVKPIWDEKEEFKNIPESKFFLVHARSSSFENQKNFLEYNQPFISKKYSFVFNGFIKGVSLPFKISGSIGSQKIWNLLLELLKRENPEKSLAILKEIILKNSRSVQALNIGLSDGVNLYALCYYESNPDYYSLFYANNPSISIISSEIIPNFDFRKLSAGEVVVL